jgi:hypothetical protein
VPQGRRAGRAAPWRRRQPSRYKGMASWCAPETHSCEDGAELVCARGEAGKGAMLWLPHTTVAPTITSWGWRDSGQKDQYGVSD